ncbi:MAG: sulfatase-like hydrolase/transferase, partial [Myxococcota bacterium]
MSKKKNILLIMVDEERMPMHFPEDIALPARQWLRERGVSFDNYHVTTAPCTPSRSVIFTGQHTLRTGMIDNTNLGYVQDLRPEIATLGDMAAAAGYYSVYKGKWHLADIEDTQDPRTTTEVAMQQYGFNDFQHDGDLLSFAREGYTHDGRVAAEALYWLDTWVNYRTEESQDRPFFLVCSFVNPHDIMTVDIDSEGTIQQQPERAASLMPIMGPPDHALYREQYAVELCDSWRRDFNRETHESKPSAHREFDRIFTSFFVDIPKDEAMWKAYVNYYINCYRDVDRHMMRLLQYLEDTGLDRDTIVIFTSDHGEMAGAHGLRTKGPFIYKENNNVPLIICHPDGVKGTTTQALGSAVDLAPTLMSLCGLEEEQRTGFPHLFGHDLSPVVFDQDAAGTRTSLMFTYSALSMIDADFVLGLSKRFDLKKRGLLLGIRTGTHKFARYFAPLVKTPMPTTIEVLRAEFDLELYDIAADPDEITNLANDSAHDALLLDLNHQLNALIRAEIGDVPLPTKVPDDLATI